MIDPGGAAGRFGKRLPGRVNVEKVAAEDSVARRKLINQLQHQRRERGGVLLSREMEAIPLHRADRAHPHQLGVVTLSEVGGQSGKGLIKHELAVAVTFEIKRSEAHQLFIAPEGEMQRLPALVRGNTSRILKRDQPVPAIKGNGRVIHQALPVRLRNLPE